MNMSTPRVPCRVRKVLQLEGGRRLRNSRHSARLMGHVCQHKKRNISGVREHRVCEFSDGPREPDALDQAGARSETSSGNSR